MLCYLESEQPLGLTFSSADIAPFWVLCLTTHEFGDFPTLADGSKLFIALGGFQGLFLLILSGFLSMALCVSSHIFRRSFREKPEWTSRARSLCCSLSPGTLPCKRWPLWHLDTQLYFLIPERPRSSAWLTPLDAAFWILPSGSNLGQSLGSPLFISVLSGIPHLCYLIANVWKYWFIYFDQLVVSGCWINSFETQLVMRRNERRAYVKDWGNKEFGVSWEQTGDWLVSSQWRMIRAEDGVISRSLGVASIGLKYYSKYMGGHVRFLKNMWYGSQFKISLDASWRIGSKLHDWTWGHEVGGAFGSPVRDDGDKTEKKQ